MSDDFTRRDDEFSNDYTPPRDAAPVSGAYPSDPWASNRQDAYPEKKSGCSGCLMGCGCGCLVLILLLVLGGFLIHAYCIKGVPLAISPETTVLTEPLKEDGKNVDFFRPIEEMSEPAGVDNGFQSVLVAYGREMYKPQFVADFGPERGKAMGVNREWQYDETCKKLGVAPAAATCVYESPSDYLTLPKTEVVVVKKDGAAKPNEENKEAAPEKSEKTEENKPDEETKIIQLVNEDGADNEELNRHFRDQITRSMTLHQLQLQPWTLKEQPKMKDWLDKVGPGLDILRAAAMKEYYFIPMVRRNDQDLSLLSVSPDAVRFHDKLINALRARAMYRLGDGKPEEAWKDTLAALRLSCFLNRTGGLPGTDHFLTSISQVWHTAQALAKDESWTAGQLDRVIADLEALPKIADRKQRIRQVRFHLLDAIGAAGNLPQFLESISGHAPPPGSAEMLSMFGFNWNIVSKRLNQRFDALESKLDEQDPEKLYEIFRQHGETVFAEMRDVSDDDVGRFFLSAMTVAGRSEKIGDLGTRGIAHTLNERFKAELQQEARVRLLRAAFALERYRLEKKDYPETLEQLGLKALEPALSIQYEKTEAGYVLSALEQKIEKPEKTAAEENDGEE